MEPGPDTKDKLLDAAEKLFVQQGIGATSLRNITTEAGANLASIHYHFGSKDALIAELFKRRIGPINKERLKKLEALGDEKESISLEKLVEAFVAPALHSQELSGEKGKNFVRLMGHIFSESEKTQNLVLGQFSEVAQRFLDAFGSMLPDLPRQELSWRFEFSLGAMAMAMTGNRCTHKHLNIIEKDHDSCLLLQRLITYIAGALRAPAPQFDEQENS